MTDQPAPARRRKKQWIWISAIAVVLIVAGVFVGSRIYAASVSAQADAVPTLAATTTSGASNGSGASNAAPSPADRAGTWAIDSGSFAGYRLDEVLNGANVTVTGRTEDISGSLTVHGDALTAANLTLNVATISTDSSRRDDYFRNTAIDTSRHPEATFVLTDPVEVLPSGDGTTQTFSITGDLEINGQTRSVTAEVKAAFGDGTAQLVGQIPLTWADFGVEAPNLGFVSVEDTGFIEFSLDVTQK